MDLFKALQSQPQISGENYGGFFQAMANSPKTAAYVPQPGQPEHAPHAGAINMKPPQPPPGEPSPQITGDNYGGFFKAMANR